MVHTPVLTFTFVSEVTRGLESVAAFAVTFPFVDGGAPVGMVFTTSTDLSFRLGLKMKSFININVCDVLNVQISKYTLITITAFSGLLNKVKKEWLRNMER